MAQNIVERNWNKLTRRVRILTGIEPQAIHAVSYPKSGRTWIELMVAKLYSEVTGQNISNILNQHHLPFWHEEKKHYIPRVVFSHGIDNFQICQSGTFPVDFYRNQRIFLLVRDPRDVVVSYYFHAKWRSEKFDQGLGDFIRYPFDEVIPIAEPTRFGIQPIINYMNAWARHRQIFQSLYVAHYEDFRQDPHSEFKKLCEYIGLDIQDNLLERIIAYGSFENMRQLEVSNRLDWSGLRGNKDQRGLKTRKGLVGGYKEELSPQDVDYINQLIDQQLDTLYDRYKRY